VIDDASPRTTVARATSQRADGESHRSRVPVGQTGAVTPAIQFGRDLPDDRELRLCGDISDGKRALELGISRQHNAVAFALAGAKAIAVDPSTDAVTRLRTAAAKAEVTVECHTSDLADLGFATSGSMSLVVANHTLDDVDDLGRLLRQVHRVLRASHPFVISVPHPFAGVHSSDQYGSKVKPYGSVGRTIGDWFVHLGRANFRVDQILELGVSEISPVPTTLVMRARKEGD
jgi:SAM-dependent methyltransferase